MFEKTIKERLEKVLQQLDEYADEKKQGSWDCKDDVVYHNLIGLRGGANYVRGLIIDEFAEILTGPANDE